MHVRIFACSRQTQYRIRSYSLLMGQEPKDDMDAGA